MEINRQKDNRVWSYNFPIIHSIKCPILDREKFKEASVWAIENCKDGWYIDDGSFGFAPSIRVASEKDYVAFLLKWS